MAISKSDLKVRKPPVKPKKDLEPFIKEGQRVRKIRESRWRLSIDRLSVNLTRPEDIAVPLGTIGTIVDRFYCLGRFWYDVAWEGSHRMNPGQIGFPYCLEDALIMLEPVED